MARYSNRFSRSSTARRGGFRTLNRGKFVRSIQRRKGTFIRRGRNVNANEPKYINTALQSDEEAGGPLMFSSTPRYCGLNFIQTGSARYQRVGSRIKLKYVRLRFEIDLVGTLTAAAYQQDFIRILLVYDRQPNGDYPDPTDVLLSQSQTGATVTSSYSEKNKNNSERFTILKDWNLTAPRVTLTGTPANVTFETQPDQLHWFTGMDHYVDLSALEEPNYKSSTNPAVVGDIAAGHLFVMTIGAFPDDSEVWQVNGRAELCYMG